MAHRPLFSIATPCYNSEKTIERTIKSVLQQEFKDYEYIIVDGGSTDGTLDIIKKYEPLFEGRMKWKSEPDKGIYDAFNKGVQRSSGYYCWNVNSDDWIESDALGVLAPYALENINRECVLCSRLNLYKNDVPCCSKLVTQESIRDAGESLMHMGISHPASVYSKVVYETIGLYDDRYYISGDIDHFIRCYQNKSVSFIPVDAIIINMSDGGISNTFNLRKVNHDWKIRFSKFCPSRFQYVKMLVLSNLRYLKNNLF